jgi:transcriptional regulator with GAF, ATPase, and Fis domain
MSCLSQAIDEQREHQALGSPTTLDFRAPSLWAGGDAIVYRSEAIRAVLDQIGVVAPTTATVLLLGETGVGKELFAEAIHHASPRRRRPMIRVNCAAIPSTLIERELFGHERGAFTGAVSRQIGHFEAANGSTLFLDEIGELPLELQVKLLRVLQERTIERLGGTASMKVDVRIVAATNIDLEDAVRTKSFRPDLFYRLNVFPITIPPLRDRIDDVPVLVGRFIDEFARAFGKRIDGVSSSSMTVLQQYAWPGNVRELRNIIERAVILASGPTLSPTISRGTGSTPVSGPSTALGAGTTRLDDVQAAHIRSVLDTCGWRIRGPMGAAIKLGMKPSTLESRMAKLGIKRAARGAAVDSDNNGQKFSSVAQHV